jgi:hypothetical protein
MLYGQQNIRTSFLKSAILPGWGELSNNHRSGYAFMTAEFMLWFSKYYFSNESKLYDKASTLYAIKYAHINASMSYDEEYYDNLRRFLSSGYESGGYNADVVLKAKYIYPDDLIKQQEYILANIYEDDFFWQWDDKDKQRDYKIMRKRITQHSDYSKSVTGFIILNHLASAFNSTRISAKLKRLEFRATFDDTFSPGLACRYQF